MSNQALGGFKACLEESKADKANAFPSFLNFMCSVFAISHLLEGLAIQEHKDIPCALAAKVYYINMLQIYSFHATTTDN